MNTSVLRLWQLISPALPVGAYAYSAGLEYACEAGWVCDEVQALAWARGQLEHGLAALDVPLLARLQSSWEAGADADVERWNDFLRASRDTRELREEDAHLGTALARLLADLGVPRAEPWFVRGDACFATSFALAAAHWRIAIEQAAAGYLWAWCENQVAAAVKLVPLGQTAGQRMLLALADAIPAVVAAGLAIEEADAIGGACPGVVLASAWHETQYSRLFRS